VARILVGTSSWTDKTLVESGRFYPAAAKTPEDRLRFYASQFPIVEIDSSYYGIPSVENAQRWVERTPPGFVFNIKAYRLFTRHATPVVSLSKEIRDALGSVDRKNVYDHELPPELTIELWRQFRSVLEVLRADDKLGVVHMQFAPWVAFHPDTFDYIEQCRAMLAGFTVAAEFRNKTWFDTDRHAARTRHGDDRLDDSGHQRLVLQQRGARSDIADLLRRAAHVDVDDLRAGLDVVQRGLGHHLRIAAGDLDDFRRDFTLVIAAANRFLGAPQQRVRRDHLGHRHPRAHRLGKLAKRAIRDPSHRRNDEVVLQNVGADAHEPEKKVPTTKLASTGERIIAPLQQRRIKSAASNI